MEIHFGKNTHVRHCPARASGIHDNARQTARISSRYRH
jgi:hypothetical protein